MSSSDPPFKTISIVGLGLIGGSIALAVREVWPATRIAGVDRKAVLAHALGSGAIDRAGDSAADAADADLIILAAPVRQNLKLLAEISQRVPAATIVTDVGSTKRGIVDAAASLAFAAFVGGQSHFAQSSAVLGSRWRHGQHRDGQTSGPRRGGASGGLRLGQPCLGQRRAEVSGG